MCHTIVGEKRTMLVLASGSWYLPIHLSSKTFRETIGHAKNSPSQKAGAQWDLLKLLSDSSLS